MDEMTLDEYHALSAKPARGKYNAQKTTVDGVTFDSKAEAMRYLELKAMQAAGEIDNLELQPRYTLQEGFTFAGKRERAIVYTADFSYYHRRAHLKIIEDVKGRRTEAYTIRRKLLLAKLNDKTTRFVEVDAADYYSKSRGKRGKKRGRR